MFVDALVYAVQQEYEGKCVSAVLLTSQPTITGTNEVHVLCASNPPLHKPGSVTELEEVVEDP